MQGLKLETLNLKDGTLRLALTLHVLGLGVLFRHYFRHFSPWEGQPYMLISLLLRLGWFHCNVN
jgi:hypothetical protein